MKASHQPHRHADLTPIQQAVHANLTVLDQVGPNVLNQGGVALEKRTKAGAYVMKFVVEPGEDMQLILLRREPRRRARLDGLLHIIADYNYDPSLDFPHQPNFERSGRVIIPRDVPEIIAKLEQPIE